MVTRIRLRSGKSSPRSRGPGLLWARPTIRPTWRSYAWAGSDGQQAGPSHDPVLHRGRFSEGQELRGDDDPEKHIRRRFSEGIETNRSTG